MEEKPMAPVVLALIFLCLFAVFGAIGWIRTRTPVPVDPPSRYIVVEVDGQTFNIPRDTATAILSANYVIITRDSAGAYHVETKP